MLAAAFDYVRRVASRIEHRSKCVLDIGGRDVNGSPRSLFAGALAYVGLDVRSGPGVDIVLDCARFDGHESFDIVVTCETLEHHPAPADVIHCARRALKPGGRLIITAASDPRPPHRHTGESGVPDGEHYRNIDPLELRDLLRDWRDVEIEYHAGGGDVYATACRDESSSTGESGHRLAAHPWPPRIGRPDCQKLKVLVAARHFPVASGRYVLDALRRMGHQAMSTGPEMGTEVWRLSLPPRYVWTPDDVRGYSPDLLIVMDADPTVQEAYAGHPAPLKVVYGVDNHVAAYRRGYDHYFLAHHHGPAQPVDPGRADMTWLPCGFDPTIFQPGPTPWHERRYDVACVGAMYPRRREMAESLRAAGFSVLSGTGLVYENLAWALQDARISLCASHSGDVAIRIFESGACGSLVMTDPLHDLEDSTTRDRLGLLGYVVYRGMDDLISQVQRILHGDGEEAARNIGMMALAVTPHTWDARAGAIMEWASRRIHT